MTRKQQKQSRESSCDACKSCGPKNSPCIVCSPFQKSDRYYSDSSDSSCPDFSDLCRDEPRKCKDEKKSKSSKESSDSSESSQSSCSKESSSLYTSSSSASSDSSACGSCRKGCGACSRTTACACRSCSDYSASDVLREFESDYSGCIDYSALAGDQSRKCAKPEPKPVDPSPKKPIKGKKFVVKFASKTGHPWAAYNPGADSIHVNGKNGPVLHLQQGNTYYFCVEQDVPPGAEAPHLFILTTSPMGGPGSEIIPGGFNPVVNGTVCLKVDKSTPRYFFYQDTRDICAGGLVVVHNNA